jgi:hypothetical protein
MQTVAETQQIALAQDDRARRMREGREVGLAQGGPSRDMDVRSATPAGLRAWTTTETKTAETADTEGISQYLPHN